MSREDDPFDYEKNHYRTPEGFQPEPGAYDGVAGDPLAGLDDPYYARMVELEAACSYRDLDDAEKAELVRLKAQYSQWFHCAVEEPADPDDLIGEAILGRNFNAEVRFGDHPAIEIAGDTTMCRACGLRWDTNDDPPECRNNPAYQQRQFEAAGKRHRKRRWWVCTFAGFAWGMMAYAVARELHVTLAAGFMAACFVAALFQYLDGDRASGW